MKTPSTRPLAFAAALTVLALGAAGTAAAATWSDPATVSSQADPTGTNASGPAIAADAAGVATLVWGWERGVGNTLLYSLQGAAGSAGAWADSAAVSPDSGDRPQTPAQVVVDAMGTATVVWYEYDRSVGGVVVKAARRVAGTWAPVAVISDPTKDSSSPSIGVDANGVVTAAWTSTDPNSAAAVIVSSRYANGTWSQREQLSDEVDPVRFAARDARAAVSAMGTVMVSWSITDLSDFDQASRIKTRRWSPGSGWAADVIAASEPGTDAFNSVAALDASGAGTVAWLRYDGAQTGVEARHFDAAGTWDVQPTALSGWMDNLGMASISASPGGVTTVAWSGGPAFGTRMVQARRFTPSSGWDVAPLDVSPAPGAPRGDLSVVMGGDGAATVVWQEGGAFQTVRARQSTTSGAWTSADQQISGGDANSYQPVTAIDPAGAVTAAWQFRDSPGQVIQSAFLASTPAAPTGVAGGAGDAQVTASWTAPLANGGAAITSYRVTARPGGGSCTATAPATTCVVGGLTNGTAYTLTAAAANAEGVGPESDPSAPVTPVAGTTPTAEVVVKRLATSVSCRRTVCTTTGTLPAGVTSVTQSAVMGSASAERSSLFARSNAKRAAGKCVIRRAGKRVTYRCTITLRVGRSVVTTRAFDDGMLVARSVRRVRILSVPPVTG